MIPARAQRGVALVTAMLVVAIIGTVAAFLGLSQQVWLRQTQNLMDLAQADSLRLGALRFAAIGLTEDAKRSKVDDLTEDWAKGLPLPVEGGYVVIKVSDASARFNLNGVIDRSGKPDPAAIGTFQRLLSATGLAPKLSHALVDWIDKDSVTQGGAEVVETLKPHVIALPAKTPLNINTASETVLAALFNIPEAQAAEIVRVRERKPFTDKAQIEPLLPKDARGEQPYDVQTAYFIVTVETHIGRTLRRTEALVHRPLKGQTHATVLWQRRPPLKLIKHEDSA